MLLQTSIQLLSVYASTPSQSSTIHNFSRGLRADVVASPSAPPHPWASTGFDQLLLPAKSPKVLLPAAPSDFTAITFCLICIKHPWWRIQDSNTIDCKAVTGWTNLSNAGAVSGSLASWQWCRTLHRYHRKIGWLDAFSGLLSQETGAVWVKSLRVRTPTPASIVPLQMELADQSLFQKSVSFVVREGSGQEVMGGWAQSIIGKCLIFGHYRGISFILRNV